MKNQNLQTITESEKSQKKLKEVIKKLKNAKTHLKRKNTQLINLEANISQALRHDIPNFIDSIEDLQKKKQVILELKPSVKKLRGAKRVDKREILNLIESFSAGDFIPHEMEDVFDENFKEKTNKYHLEDDESKSSDLFQDFIVEPSKTEQYDIRKIYISLADKFHPDKAKNKKEEEEFHHIMQKINNAYKKFDYNTLYQMKMDYDKTLEQKEENSNNSLDEKIETLKNEIKYIKNQAKRIQEQINKTKNSEVGLMSEMFTAENKEEFEQIKVGFDLTNEILLVIIELITEFLETKKINDERLIKIEEQIEETNGMFDNDFDDDFDDDFDENMMQMFTEMMIDAGKKNKKNKKKIRMSKFEEEMIKEMLFSDFQEEMSNFSTPKKKKKKKKKK